MEKDYIDKLGEGLADSRPEFAAHWAALDIVIALGKLRVELGLSQQEVADRMGVARPRVVEIENGSKKTSFDRVMQYAIALGAGLDVALPKPTKKKAEPTSIPKGRGARVSTGAADRFKRTA